jgi:hypothetical protein
MSVSINGADLVNESGRTIGSSSQVPRFLQMAGVNYSKDEGPTYRPVMDANLRNIVLSTRLEGGRVVAVGPEVTKRKPSEPMRIGKRNVLGKHEKKCLHQTKGRCQKCEDAALGILVLSAARAKAKHPPLVDRAELRIPTIIGSLVVPKKTALLETTLRTATIRAEDPVTLSLMLVSNPMMRDAVAVATQGLNRLNEFRALSQVIYTLRQLMSRDQFAAFLTDGVATIAYKTILMFPKGAELAEPGLENRMAMVWASDNATPEPKDSVTIGIPALWECLERLKRIEVRRRLIISFVHNGTGEPGMVRNLAEFAPDRHSATARVTVRVNNGPLQWSDVTLLLDTFDTVILEASYFNPAEVALFYIAGIMLRLEPDNVKTAGMPVVNDALRASRRMTLALGKFSSAQKHGIFGRVREGGAMPEIVVADDGRTNLARVKQVQPLLQHLAARLDPATPQGLRLQPEPGAAESTNA